MCPAGYAKITPERLNGLVGIMENRITLAELREYDGRDGRPAYVAHAGKVYDVSESRLWRDGAHQRRHQAGEDLTAAFAGAPHAETVLARVPQVGVLEVVEAEAEVAPPALVGRLLDLHPHPVTVHFPIALILVAAAFAVFSLLLDMAALYVAAYYTLLVGVIMALPAAIFGVISWRYNYSGRGVPPFKAKLGLAALLLPLSIASLTLWSLYPLALGNREPIGWVYFALLLAACPLVLLLGMLGGEIVFPKKRK
jgi:predicted heme/steroid binding protein/uncharacterized membrane protein